MKLNKSTKALLTTGRNLFWKHGIKRVSVDELCKEAGVSKMTFYRYFDSKFELVKHLLKEQMDSGIESYREIMAKDIEYEEKIRLVLEFKRNQSNQISMELVKDIFSGDADYQDLQNYMQAFQVNFTSTLRKDFIEAQKCGHIRADVKVDFIIYMLGVMQNQLADPAFLSMYENPTQLSEDLTKMFFYGILNK